MKKGFLFFILSLIFPSVVLAGTIFTVTPLDRSVQYLGMIFGNTVGAINLVGTSNNLTLSLMFQYFNYMIVTVGAVVLGYMAVLSTVNTAREGEAMGKKISMWVPLRALSGMLLMVPGPSSGYSIVQMTVLWVVLNGIGAANAVWNVVLTQLSKNISATSGVTLPEPSGPVTYVNNALIASTCMYAINSNTSLQTIPGPIQQYGSVKIYSSIQPIPTQPRPTGGGNTSISQTATLNVGIQGAPAPYDTMCGQFLIDTTINSEDNATVSYNASTLSQITTVKLQAVQAMFNAVDQAAQALGQGTSPSQVDPGYTYTASQAFLGQMTNLANGLQMAPNTSSGTTWDQSPPPSTNTMGANFQQYAQVGWIHAGSLYYTMVQASTVKPNANATWTPSNSFAPNVIGSIPASGSYTNPAQITALQANWPLSNGGNSTAITTALQSPSNQNTFNYAMGAATFYGNNAGNAQPSGQGFSISPASAGGNPIVAQMIKGIASGIQQPILKGIQKMLSPSGNTSDDPLIAMGQFGTELMSAGEIGMLGTLAVSFGITVATAWQSCILSTPWAITATVASLVSLASGGFFLLWTTGATLGIYVPLAPYLIFTTTAFGWFIAVVEAMLGAPIIALGLVHPSGEELGKAVGGLPIIANIFLRPTLMIFGFVIGATLLRAGIALINFGFGPALTGATTPTIFSILAVLGLYVYLMIGIVNQAFSLIYMLPNQILRWMGGQAESFDPGKMTQEAKQGFDSGAKGAQGAGDAAVKSLKDKGAASREKYGEGMKEKAKEAKAAEATAAKEANKKMLQLEAAKEANKKMLAAEAAKNTPPTPPPPPPPPPI